MTINVHFNVSVSSRSRKANVSASSRSRPLTSRAHPCRTGLLDFMVQGKINRGRHTDHPAGRHSIQKMFVIITILLRKWCHNNKHFPQLAPHHGGKSWRRYGTEKLCHCHPMYRRFAAVQCTASLCVVRCHSWRQMLLDNVQRTPATTDSIQITLQQPKPSLLTYKLQAAYLTHHARLTATNELRILWC